MILTFDYTVAEGHVTTIQWYLNGVALVDGTYGITTISGATTKTLTIDNPTVSYNGAYFPRVTDTTANCSVDGDTLIVDICTLAIQTEIAIAICFVDFTTQPSNTIVDEGEDVVLTIGYTSVGGPYTIQWFKDDVPLTDGPTGNGSTISGSSTITLTVTAADPTDTGTYYAQVNNESFDGCINQSDSASVTVNEAPAVPTPNGFWKLNEINEPIVAGEGAATDRVDQVAGSTLVLLSGTVPGYQDAQGGDTASAEFLNSASGDLKTNDVAALAYTSPNSLSFSVWVKVREAIVNDNLPRIRVRLDAAVNGEIEIIANAGGGGTVLDMFFDGPSTSDFIELDPFTMLVDQWYMWSLVFDGGTGLFTFYIDTTAVATSSVPVTFGTSATGSLELQQPASSTNALMSQFALWMDYALTPTDITTLFNAGAGITCCPFA